MKSRSLLFGIGVLAIFSFGVVSSLGAREKAAQEGPVAGPPNEMEEGSQAAENDGMDKSRFDGDEDDTYTDDSDSLDDLNKSKFQDEKNDDDQGTDTQDQDNP